MDISHLDYCLHNLNYK